MKLLELGGLRVRALGGEDREGGGDGPAVLLCHGFGAPGDDLVGLARGIDAGPGVRWFFPEAPIALEVGMGMTGRAWWPIDMMRLQMAMARGEPRNLDETPDGLGHASTLLRACIDALVSSQGVDPKRLVIGGFSQGAMLTTEVALHDPRVFAGLAILSGTLVSRERWTLAAKTRAPSLHVLQTHGRHDPILPFGTAEVLSQMLQAAGADLRFVPFAGQHAIPAPALDALGAFCRARLG
jgi:phospholipase/carboxylesterase